MSKAFVNEDAAAEVDLEDEVDDGPVLPAGARNLLTPQVFFGAWVTFENSRGEEKTVRIVGVDEARLEEGEISWVSPMARALMKAEEGDVVNVRTPQGLDEVEVIRISYDGP